MLLTYFLILLPCLLIIEAGIIGNPMVECPDNVANVDVIEFIWKLVILDISKRTAVKDDMQRLFAFMDISGDPVPMVNFAEFQDVFECTTMHFNDLRYVYNIIESKDGHPGISQGDIDTFWRDHISSDPNAKISRDDFIGDWQQILKHAPHCGLIDPSQAGLLYIRQLCIYLIGDGF